MYIKAISLVTGEKNILYNFKVTEWRKYCQNESFSYYLYIDNILIDKIENI